MLGRPHHPAIIISKDKDQPIIGTVCPIEWLAASGRSPGNGRPDQVYFLSCPLLRMAPHDRETAQPLRLKLSVQR